MIVLDKSRALDLMISRAERIDVPEPFNSGFWLDPEPIAEREAASDQGYSELTNLLAPRTAVEAWATLVQDSTTRSVPLMP